MQIIATARKEEIVVRTRMMCSVWTGFGNGNVAIADERQTMRRKRRKEKGGAALIFTRVLAD